MQIELRRDIHTAESTVGVLSVNGRTFYTMERAWHPNTHGGRGGEKYISCVAPGQYRLIQHTRPSGERCWALSNPALDCYFLPIDVPPNRKLSCRTLVLIHAGNFWWDVNGCIAPGKSRCKLDGEWMVQNSRAAMNEIRMLADNRIELTLNIVDVP